MIDTAKLELERTTGQKAQHAYNDFISSFIEEKTKTLFLAFKDLPLTSEKELIEVKKMLYAIESLDDEINSIINTGKMASKILSEEENK